MTIKIIKNIISRSIISENWGRKTDLIDEEDFNLEEYTINSKDKIKLNIENENVYFILVSGSAEFSYDNQNELLFKGDKLDILAKNKTSDITITNCGVIPLVFIKINLR